MKSFFKKSIFDGCIDFYYIFIIIIIIIIIYSGRFDQRMTTETSKDLETVVWAVKVLR